MRVGFSMRGLAPLYYRLQFIEIKSGARLPHSKDKSRSHNCHSFSIEIIIVGMRTIAIVAAVLVVALIRCKIRKIHLPQRH